MYRIYRSQSTYCFVAVALLGTIQQLDSLKGSKLKGMPQPQTNRNFNIMIKGVC